jgi:hypothetical protein
LEAGSERDLNLLDSDEVWQVVDRAAVFLEAKFQDLGEIAAQFVERGGLGLGSGNTRGYTNIEIGLRIPF